MAEEKKLRHGYTTGACAAAAAKAATEAFITKVIQTHVTISLPIGQEVTFKLEECTIHEESVKVVIQKDAGDDPDATHGALIEATVHPIQIQEVVIDGGKGVGRVTKSGLPIEVGHAAINPVPRKMINGEVRSVLDAHGANYGMKVIISVPMGEEIAKKTLNERLGIIGGISILGTRGIVVPFSTAAYKASIVSALKVARLSGCTTAVITTGGRSERYAMAQYPHLSEEAFIEMGDFVGFTLKQCKRQGFERVALVGMMGKFSKVAQGVMMVHSKSAPVDFNFLAEVAERAGAPSALVEQVREANTASETGQIMSEAGYDNFFSELCHSCCESSLKEMNGGLTVETTIYTLKGEQLGKAVIEE